MKFLVFWILLAGLADAAAAQTVSGVPLDPFVGGRVVMQLADGRTSYVYDWPGVYFEGRFNGDAVDVQVNDSLDNLYLYIDGRHKLTLTRPGRATIERCDVTGRSARNGGHSAVVTRGPEPHDDSILALQIALAMPRDRGTRDLLEIGAPRGALAWVGKTLRWH